MTTLNQTVPEHRGPEITCRKEWRGPGPTFENLLGRCTVMDACVILVDNSNVYIEGTKYSARQKGVFKSTPYDRDPQDPSWRLNFGQLLTYLANGKPIAHAFLVGSRPPPNDSVWESAREGGFEVIVHNRDSNNREKAVDTELVAQGTRLIVKAPNPMTLVIASGDRDFIPLVNVAHAEGWSVEMCAFTSAYSEWGDMATSVDAVRSLDQGFSAIGFHDGDWQSS